jgi:3-isopropylmalate/(R)-2-methylmalate dehydratase small subunit
VISTSFADIFYNNCFKNGILPVIVTEEQLRLLMKDAEKGSNSRMVVDLENQNIETSDGDVITFDVDQHSKHCLINGLDDIGLTLEKVVSIDAFETKMAQSAPWV